MAIKNPTGYCNNCQQRVLLSREKFNSILAIVLFFFTGIGFFIYLIVYYSKPKDHCIHCNAKVYPFDDRISQRKYESQTQNAYNSYTNEKIEKVSGNVPKFCSFCGERLLSEDAKYCPYCGTHI
ncbi:MAG: zinc-ribbon domain-containing protein [Promethearchaeota archaeon]